jgi:hypothetical protein
MVRRTDRWYDAGERTVERRADRIERMGDPVGVRGVESRDDRQDRRQDRYDRVF